MDFAKRLPENKPFSKIHFRTNAYQCKSLTVSKPKQTTLKIKHLFLLKDLVAECIVLGIEINVYLTFQGDQLTRHIFVLKPDTTGLGSVRFSAAEVVLEVIDYLVKLNPEIYYEKASFKEKDAPAANPEEKYASKSSPSTLSGCSVSEYAIVNDLLALSKKLEQVPGFLRKTRVYLQSLSMPERKEFPLYRPSWFNNKISLFTRAADSYIFPESKKNAGKHVATGNQLFGWWMALLSKIVDSSWVCKADIPGSDARSVERFLPSLPNWSRGNIYVTENENYAIRSIPLFPDDPKGRFLEHLIVENRYKGMTTTRYWNELAFRQEFRLGNVVGIIGCTDTKKNMGGITEDPSTIITTRKEYRKINDFIKGEDYTKKDDIVRMCRTGMNELVARLGLDLVDVSVIGSRKPSRLTSGEASTAVVTNLTGLVKKRKK